MADKITTDKQFQRRRFVKKSTITHLIKNTFFINSALLNMYL
ncbi:hypothetical protein [Pseudoalteromonas sp. NBT06-2]|nr:hypothetical protein [Pseudoalteromonas sp. NBT06-2]